jgi:NAD-dependent dihydropyrimidine dehydrogenase PreA subunit
MAKGEITINENLCTGCGYCVHFCPQDCIAISKDFGPQGYKLAVFANPESCTACGVCNWMCPIWAIEVYKFKDEAKARR